jgi:hypothetical protein
VIANGGGVHLEAAHQKPMRAKFLSSRNVTKRSVEANAAGWKDAEKEKGVRMYHN